MQQRLLNRSLANFAHDLQIELLDLLPFLNQVNFLVAGELLPQHRAHLHTAFDVENQFRDFVLLHGVRSRGPSLVVETRQAALRLAAQRFFCASEIRFRAAADIFRRPRLAAPVLTPRGPRFAFPATASTGAATGLGISPFCFAHRAFCASEMRWRASADIVRLRRRNAAGEEAPSRPATFRTAAAALAG